VLCRAQQAVVHVELRRSDNRGQRHHDERRRRPACGGPWGSPETKFFTANVSYGYPGGMNVQPINQVVIPPMPK
jgi:hypothetical protein